MKKTVFILSGPAGVGKTTIWKALEKNDPKVEKIITSTTRKPRDGEVHGVDYYFLDRQDFLDGIESGDFIEHAYVHGDNIYGSTHAELERVLSHDKFPFYIVEPQGMKSLTPTLKEKGYNVISVFILPPSMEVLEERLGGRGTEGEDEKNTRLCTAKNEIACKDLYKYHIVNDDLDHAVQEIQNIIDTYAI
ncbi:guanylate kinase [Candidatus Gracilibacteria bacterium]|nr:MAG: guanylate kinase [Candidatus Gracilibacteria bacterium]